MLPVYALGTVALSGAESLPNRVRRVASSCPTLCSTSSPDLLGRLQSPWRGAALRVGLGEQRICARTVKATAFLASQGNAFGASAFGAHPILISPMGLRDAMKQAAAYAVFLALKFTAAVVHAARMAVLDVQKAWLRREAEARAAESLKAEALAVRQAEELMEAKRRRKAVRLMREAQDDAFQQMLQSMDDTSINLDDKWASIQRHNGKSEFSRHIRKLFTAAGEASSQVHSQALTSTSMWKSEITQAVIAEEAALKRIVFQQMLRGSQA